MYAVSATNINMAVTWKFDFPTWRKASEYAEKMNRQNYKVEILPMSAPEVIRAKQEREEKQAKNLAEMQAHLTKKAELDVLPKFVSKYPRRK